MKLVKALFFVCGFTLCNISYASYEAPRIGVDVLVIKNLSKSQVDEQDKYHGEINFKGAKRLSELKDKRFIKLDDEDVNLLDEARAIARSKDFKVLEHFAWEQDYTELDKHKVLFPDVITEELQDKEASIDVTDLYPSTTLTSNIDSYSPLAGTVLVTPHGSNAIVSVDFNYTGDNQVIPGRITARKIIGRNQTLYLDHPNFGIIVKLSKAKKAVVDEDDQSKQLSELSSTVQ